MRPDEYKQRASRVWSKAHPEGRGGYGGGRGRGRGRGGGGGSNATNNLATNETDFDLDDEAKVDEDGVARKSYSRRKIESNEYRFAENVDADPNIPPGRSAPISDEQAEQAEADKKILEDIREVQKVQWEQGRYQDLKEQEELDVRQLANALKQAPVKKKLDLSKFASASGLK